MHVFLLRGDFPDFKDIKEENPEETFQRGIVDSYLFI